MSDPVTNVEIEDVLSSIRRLVSAETNADGSVGDRADKSQDATAEDTAPVKHPEPKLVLTPAQRVNDTVAPEPETEAASEPEADSGNHDSDQTELEPDPETQTVEPVDETSEDDLLDKVGEEINATAASEDMAEVQETLTDAAEDDTPASQDDQDLSFDDMSDPDVPEFLRRPITQMNPPEDAEIVEEEPAPATETLTAKLETLEDAVADQAEDWEPDGGDPENLSVDTIEPLPWTEIEAETAEMPEDTANEDPYSEAETASATPPWFGQDAVLDEEALRDMVGEIVRQELQGALGERITRNVRKLVRREIHRALMSQGLD
ncbi:MAG: hypothetical protein AAFY25_01000 [Pseudomonadota bacterium]